MAPGGGRRRSGILCGERTARYRPPAPLPCGSSARSEVRFRFDAVDHRYIELETGDIFPSITQMLQRSGWIDDTWYTEESSERGRAVHKLTADYDLGALDLASCVSRYRPYLLGHVAAVNIIRPVWDAVEEPRVHAYHRYAGTSDRVGTVYNQKAVVDGKTGEETKAHAIQTALQAILEAERYDLRPESLGRFNLYWKADGRFKLIEHTRRADFDEAYRIIRNICG